MPRGSLSKRGKPFCLTPPAARCSAGSRWRLGQGVSLPALHFSPDSKMLALHGDAKQKIELYEVSSGKLRRTFDAGPAAPPAQGGIFPGMMAPFQKMLYFADGKALAFQDGPGATITVRDTTTGNEIASLTPVKDSLAMQRAFSPDGRCLALEMSDGTVTLYELASGQPRRIYGTKRTPPSAVNSDPLAGFVGDPVFIDQSKVSVAIAPDGKLLALSGPGGSVHLWDVVTGKELAAFKGHTTAVTAVAFAPNGKTLASASARHHRLDLGRGQDRPARAAGQGAEAWRPRSVVAGSGRR